LRSW